MIGRGAVALACVAPACACGQADAQALRVFGNTSTLEIAPVLLAAQQMGSGAVTVSSGGIPNLFSGEADVATNAETQALRVSVEHPNLRVIFTVAEGYYRIVGRKSSGIAKLADLRGKRIGTIPQTSSAYFLHAMLATAALSEKDVTLVPLVPIDKIPAALRAGEVDAATVWEPEIQNAADALGADAIEFQNKAVYRELFNLNTTAEKLADPAKRQQIVAFVAQLIRACEQIRGGSQEAIGLVAQASGFDAGLIKKVWAEEGFHGTLVHDLPDVMTEEDAWLAGANDPLGTGMHRAARPRAQLVRLVDPAVRLEALALLHPPSDAPSIHTLAEAQQAVARLETDIANVEGIRAVKRLQYAYAHYIEQGRWGDAAGMSWGCWVTTARAPSGKAASTRTTMFASTASGRLP